MAMCNGQFVSTKLEVVTIVTSCGMCRAGNSRSCTRFCVEYEEGPGFKSRGMLNDFL